MGGSDREWLRYVAATKYLIKKDGNQYRVVDARDRNLRLFRRRYEAEAFVNARLGREMAEIEERIRSAAGEMVVALAERNAGASPPEWDGCAPTELDGHAVYRAVSWTGEVLYVGVTNSIFKRMGDHRATSAWWGAAKEIHWTVYPDRAEALRAEAEAIRYHRPPHNVVGMATGVA